MWCRAAGLGFASIENMIYISEGAEAAIQSGDGVLGAVVLSTFARSMAGPGHVIWSAIAGFYLGMAKFNPDNYGPLVVKGLLIAALLHGSYDFVAIAIVPILASVFGPVVNLLTYLSILVFHLVVLVYLVRLIRSHRPSVVTETPEREVGQSL
ncbi:PrsW family intramembrane metalloprotease [Halomarina oriensis]|uniref:PrsW family intramembrane metalloprotease n=1 Tax=Halomarina oriensis TaxID=671145 RepID=A0A6B0GMK8_9EURY|nr:PrsW family intramembrane metalloprotease [Halomarina oriensis]